MKPISIIFIIMSFIAPIMVHVYARSHKHEHERIQIDVESIEKARIIADDNLIKFIRGYDNFITEEDLKYGSPHLVDQAWDKL